MNVRDTAKIGKKPKGKEKSKLNKKTLINEPIPLSNRFTSMDIEDPVETTIEDSEETTTHIETDIIKLQKKLNKKIPKTTQQKIKQIL